MVDIHLSIKRHVKDTLQLYPNDYLASAFTDAEIEQLTWQQEWHVDEYSDFIETVAERLGEPVDCIKHTMYSLARQLGLALYVVNENEEVEYAEFNRTRWLQRSPEFRAAAEATVRLYNYAVQHGYFEVTNTDGESFKDSAERALEIKVRSSFTDGLVDEIGQVNLLVYPEDEDSSMYMAMYDFQRGEADEK